MYVYVYTYIYIYIYIYISENRVGDRSGIASVASATGRVPRRVGRQHRGNLWPRCP